jgi:hypothetical protein
MRSMAEDELALGSEARERAVAEWVAARRGSDDRGALEIGRALIDAGACPLEIRLCLPNCWLRERGGRGLGELLDAVGNGPGLTGAERALVAVAGSRLHVAALCTAELMEPALLLFAASLGAVAQGRAGEAARWLELCAAPTVDAELFEAVVALELAAASRDAAPPSGSGAGTGSCSATLAAPDGPPSSAVASRICAALARRSAELDRQGRPIDALGATELGLSVARGALEPSHPLSLSLLARAAEGRLRLGQGEAAERALAEAAGAATAALGEAHPAARAARLALARHWLERDSPEEALAALGAEAQATAAALGDAHPDLAPLLAAEGTALAALGRWDEADALQRRALELHGARSGELAASCVHWLGLSQAARGDPAAAVPLLQEAAELRAALGHGHPDVGDSLVALAGALDATGQPEEAAVCLREALEAFARSVGVQDVRFRVAADGLATLLLSRGHWQEATPLLRRLIALSEAQRGLALTPELRRWRGALERVEASVAPPSAPRGGAADAGPARRSTDVRALLASFSRGEAGRHEVLRALVEHRGWLVPASLSARAPGRAVIELGGGGNAGRDAPAFTDEAAARTGERAGASGSYAQGISGVELFAAIDDRRSELQINPGSPHAERWSLDRKELQQLSQWAEAVALEQALGPAIALEEPSALRRMREFPAYIVLLDRSTGGVLTVVGHAGVGSAAAVFTAPDRLTAFLAHVPPETRASFQRATLDGRALFRMLPDQRIDGIVFNCVGPAPTLAPVALCEAALRAS